MGRSRYKIFEEYQPHFLTCTVIHWLPLFSKPDVVEIIKDSLTFLQEHERLQLYAYVIMENHLYLIASSNDLGKEIGDFKSYTARKIIDYLEERNARDILHQIAQSKTAHKKDRDYQFWQEGSHPEAIMGHEIMRQKIGYVHANPVRRGYVDKPREWRYSSARNYEGEEGYIDVITDWV
jgi:putative transposase